jgi:hypothetical protein
MKPEEEETQVDTCFKTRVGVLIVVLTLLAFAVISTGIGFAQSTDNEEIFARAQRQTGQLRVVADLGECQPSEDPLSWNREGPPGPSGTVALQIVHQTTDVPTSNPNAILASALCPSGMNATGGGFRVNGDGIYVKASQPIPGPGVGNVTPIGWHAIFAYLPPIPNPPPLSTEVTVWVVCTGTP